MKKSARLLLLGAVLLTTGGSRCSLHRRSIHLDIEEPSTTGVFTTDQDSVVLEGHVDNWGRYNSEPEIRWRNETTNVTAKAFRDSHFWATRPIELILGDNTIRVRAENDGDDRADVATIVVTRTP